MRAHALLLVVLAASLTGCRCAAVAPGARFLCAGPEDCAPGTECLPDGYCAAPTGADAGEEPDGGGSLLGPGGPCAGAWCWENPSPFGRVYLYGVWTNGPDDTWVCGQAANLFHWDGTRWQQFPVTRNVELRSLWSPAPMDVTVVGATGYVAYLDGGLIAPAVVTGGSTGTLNGVFGLGPAGAPAWAVGNGERTYLRGASDWAQFGTTSVYDFEDVAAFRADDALAVGDLTRAWNGQTFSLVPGVNALGTLYSAWPRSDGAYVLGGSGSGVWVGHPDAGFVRLSVGSIGVVRAVWAPEPGDVYASSTSGAVVRGDGGEVLRLFSAAPAAVPNLHGTGHDNVWWVTSDGGVHRRAGVDGPNLDAKGETSGLGDAVAEAVALEPSGQAWAVGERHQAWWRSPAGAWAPVPTDVPSSTSFFRAVWSDGQGTVYAVGEDPSTVAKYDATDGRFLAQTVSTNAPLWGVWGSGPDDVYAVGQSGTVLHKDATDWTRLQSLPSGVDFTAVAGTSATDVYVAGLNRVVLHFDGASWTLESDSGGERIRGLCALPGGAAFAVGDQGLLLRRDAPGTWTQEAVGSFPTQQFNAVACALGRVFAVSETGLVVARQASGAWLPVPSGATVALRGIGGLDGLGFLAVGARGQVLRWVP